MPTRPDGRNATTGLVVQLAGSRWSIALSGVLEVLREARLIRVPGGVPAVRGMVNHRGRIVVVADPCRALELTGALKGSSEVVIVQASGRRFGIAVDAVIELDGEARTALADIDLERIANAIFA